MATAPNRKSFKPGGLCSRMAPLQIRSVPATLDEAARSVEFVAATEQPATVFDWDRWEPVDEVLRMDGVQLPPAQQVPLLDTHDRGSVSCVLGSFRDFRVEGDQLVGTAFFSATPEGERAMQLVREGHLTDVSVGYTVAASTWVKPGSSAEVEGRTYAGPLRVTTAWKLNEVSLCPIGADNRAKARAGAVNLGGDMPNKMQGKDGLRFDAAAASEALNTAIAALNTLAGALADVQSEVEEEAEGGEAPAAVPDTRSTDKDTDEEKEGERAVRQERERAAAIRAMGRTHNMPEDVMEKLISEGTGVDAARAVILERLAARRQSAGFARVDVGVTEQEKVRTAASQGLLLRCGIAPDRVAGRDGTLAAGAREFEHLSLRELARELLHRSGQSSGGHVVDMVGRALATTDLPRLLTETANRTLLEGWEDVEHTWSTWAGTGSLTDFRESHLINFAAMGDLELLPEGDEYKNHYAAESGESVRLATYGRIFPITRQAIINDDLGVISQIPREHGRMAARKINRLAYEALLSNPVMGDGKALFSKEHGNLVTGGGAPDATKLGAAVLAMTTQKDIAGNPVQVRPQFFIAPQALFGAAETFFRSDFVGTQAQPTTANIYAGGVFQRVYDAELDAVDPESWYLAGPKGRTVNVYFLSGANQPYLESREGWRVDGVEYKVRLDVAAAPVAWQAVVKSDKSGG